MDLPRSRQGGSRPLAGLPDDGPGSGPVPVVRPDGRLQLGLGPGAWLVDGWSPERSTHDPATVLVRGLGPPRVAPASGAARRPRSVVVLGDGELAMRLRAVEPAVAPPDTAVAPPDTAPPDTAGADAAAGRPAPHVVLVSAHVVPVGTARRPDLAGRAVLPVVLQSGRIVVGPWTGTPGAPCLHCLDLHRRDHDGAWPVVAAAFDDPTFRTDPPVHPAGVLALAQALILLLLDGQDAGHPPTRGLGYEVGERPPHLVTRQWTTHPTCSWHGPV